MNYYETTKIKIQKYILCTVRFIKPYRTPVNKCNELRQGFMKWALKELEQGKLGIILKYQFSNV